MEFLRGFRQLKARSRFSASEIEMKTKMGMPNVSGQQLPDRPSEAPEWTLIAILGAMVLLRILDIFSPQAVENPDCTPTLANQAVISCAVRPDQNRAVHLSSMAPSSRP
jgi:hypothetical protein